ncbi:cytochrome P450 [Limtongia smithiae]|uniref:cytochrome P450 n=1 Tax=Limtongia smithiae TaxID=1125753 RepID=UPI0034CF92DC
MVNSNILSLCVSAGLLAFSKWVYPIAGVFLYPLIMLVLLGKPLYDYQIYAFYTSPLRKLPHPKAKPHWLYGHFSYNIQRPDGTQVLEWAEELPNDDLMVTYGVLNNERLFPISVKAMNEVLQTHSYTFVKPPIIARSFKSILGNGILFSEGNLHKQQRRLLMPAFSFANVNSLVPVFLNESRRYVSVVRKTIAASDTPNTAIIDVSQSLSSLTLDIIYRAGLGLNFNSLEDPENELALAYKNVFAQTGAVNKIMFVLQIVIPGFKFLPFKRNVKIWKARTIIRKFAIDAIEKKLATYKASQEEKGGSNDIISVMIRESKGEWTVEDMVDQLTTFLIAGHETTAAATTLALHFLCQHQDIQDRLRAEIRTQFPGGLDAIRTYEEVESLKYLNNVAREVLRLTPPVMGTMRMASETTQICGHVVPKGTTIIISPAIMNRLHSLWGEDALEFNPDRWDGRQATSNLAFLSFLQGPRSCIGRRFAELEFRSILLAIVSSFKFSLQEGQQVQFRSSITYRPVGGLPLIVEALPDWGTDN